MRIWLLTSEWNSSSVDDLSRWGRGYAHGLASAGHEVTVFGVDPAGHREASENAPWYVGLDEPAGDPTEAPTIDPGALSHWPAVSYRVAHRVLRHAERSGAPDVIEAQSMYGLPYFLLQRKLTQQTSIEATPVVVNALGSHVGRLAANEASPYRLPDYWIGRMELFCLRAADRVLCVSAAVEAELRREFGGALPVVRFAPSPWRPGAGDVNRAAGAAGSPGELSLGCPVSLERRTGVAQLVDQCATLWATGAAFNLTLYGRDSRCAVRDLPFSQVITDRHRKWCDSGRLAVRPGGEVAGGISVFPRTVGDFGIHCAEYIAGGQRVIAARGGDPAAVLGDHTPAVFEPEDPSSLAAAMKVANGAIRGPGGGLPVSDAIRERIAIYHGLTERPTARRSFPAVGVSTANPDSPPRSDASEGETAAVKGRLSIVVPHYNLGEFLDETVASIRAADWRDREIIVVDDGSTDSASIEAIDRLAAAGASDLRLIRTSNQGPAAARNTGAAAATGEYIALVDADDLVEPEFFARCIDVLRRYEDVGFVYSWVRYFGAAEGLWPTWNAELPYLLGHNLLTVFIVMRRADYLRFGRQHSDFASDYEDYDGFISLVEAGVKGVALPDPLVRYRIRPDSRHRSYHSEQALHLYRLLTKHHAASYAAHGAELFNLQLANGAARFWSNPATAPYDPLARIAELETLHQTAWEEGQRVAAAWETQRRQIDAMSARIAELDAAYGQARAEAGELARGWEVQQQHIADQRRRIEELDAAMAQHNDATERLRAEHRLELQRQRELTAEFEAEARRVADLWSQVAGHNAEQAARIATLDRALRESQTEATRLSDAWATQRAEIDKLSAKIAELKSLRGWIRNLGRK